MKAKERSKRYLPTYKNCFVCGQGNPAGLGVRFFIEGDKVKAEFVPQEAHMGYRGIVHGGIISALLDEIMGWPLSLENGRVCISVEIRVRFKRPLPLGQRYIVSGEAVDDARRLWEGRGEIRDEQGLLYAAGWGRYLPLSEEETEEVSNYLTYGPEEERVFRRGG